MNLIKYVLGLALAVALTACGGGGGSAGTVPGAPAAVPPSGGTPAVVKEIAANIEVLTSANTLFSSGSEAVITAFIKNEANVALPDQVISFSSSSGTLKEPSAKTDASGAATVKLIAGSNKSIRDITVTATAGTASGSVVVPVTGTLVSIGGSGSLQAGGAASQYTVRAVDSSNNPIGNTQITVRSSLGNLISPASLPLTDATGMASFLYTPNIAGKDTFTVSGLGTSASMEVFVNAIDLVVLSPASNTSIPIGALQRVSVRYKLSGVGVAGQAVAFSTTRGALLISNSVTDATGQASVDLSSTTAGPAVVIAQIAGVGAVNLPVQFVATTPSSIIVQGNPGAVLPNTSGTTNQSTIEAVVRDANGNAVANRQVNFTSLQDLSNGALAPGIATTDANGRATVQFIPGASTTQANGVIIQATVASTVISDTTTLTVNGKALFITIGFGNTISNVDETTYTKPFSVYVTDANGVAVGNQLITLGVIPTSYYKGKLIDVDIGVDDYLWEPPIIQTACINEDINQDGILDVDEDTNMNRQLTPGNIVVAAPGNVTTDAFGRATFAIQYGEQFAPWVTVRITAAASVAGTESRQSTFFDLTGSISDFKSAHPAGIVSPFGSSTSCTDSN